MKFRADRIAQLILILAASALSAMPVQAQTSPTFNLSATTDVCNSCDLTTQEALANEDDRHDGADAGLDSQERSENVSHDEADQAIEKGAAPPELRQEALANEAERHQNALKNIQRQQAIETSRHQQILASIMSKAGKLLSDLISNAPVAGGAPIGGGGSPQPSGRSAGGNPAGGDAAVPPVANGGALPSGGTAPGAPAQASGGGANAPGDGESYAGGSPGGVPSVSPSAQPSPSLAAKLGKFVQAAATRAINGIPQALSYFASTSRPAAQNLQNQWTNPMSPQDAAMMVGGAWLSEAAGAGISGGKGAYNNAVANGATPQVATQAALKTGTSFFSNRAAAMASGGTAGGSIANGGLGGYGGQTVTNGMPGQRGVLVNRGGGSGGGPGNPTATGGSPAPDEGNGPLGNYLKPNFTSNLPPEVENALNNFNNGTLGQSVKGITPTQLQGKTWQQVVQDVGQAGGGWKPGDTPGTFKSGNWTLSQKFAQPLNYPDPKGIGNPAAAETDLTNANKVPQIFLSNSDGGVVRIKPWGVPGGNYTSMQQAHYALYAKTAPDAGLDWNAEAFKVVDGQAIPKTPFQIQPPAGVPKWTPAGQEWANANPAATKLPDGATANQYYSEDFENWLQQSGWPNAGHQPLARSWWSPNALGKLLGSSTAE
ncbi:MAG: hypothetical protein WA740_19070 [Candidatus Binataceae bacterium]